MAECDVYCNVVMNLDQFNLKMFYLLFSAPLHNNMQGDEDNISNKTLLTLYNEQSFRLFIFTLDSFHISQSLLYPAIRTLGFSVITSYYSITLLLLILGCDKMPQSTFTFKIWDSVYVQQFWIVIIVRVFLAQNIRCKSLIILKYLLHCKNHFWTDTKENNFYLHVLIHNEVPNIKLVYWYLDLRPLYGIQMSELLLS